MNNHAKTTAILAAALLAPIPAAFAQLEEVIVTAQKREQGLQDVPIAVTAFSTEALEKLTAQDIGDLSAFTPNVEIPRGSNQPNYKTRCKDVPKSSRLSSSRRLVVVFSKLAPSNRLGP